MSLLFCCVIKSIVLDFLYSLECQLLSIAISIFSETALCNSCWPCTDTLGGSPIHTSGFLLSLCSPHLWELKLGMLASCTQMGLYSCAMCVIKKIALG